MRSELVTTGQLSSGRDLSRLSPGDNDSGRSAEGKVSTLSVTPARVKRNILGQHKKGTGGGTPEVSISLCREVAGRLGLEVSSAWVTGPEFPDQYAHAREAGPLMPDGPCDAATSVPSPLRQHPARAGDVLTARHLSLNTGSRSSSGRLNPVAVRNEIRACTERLRVSQFQSKSKRRTPNV